MAMKTNIYSSRRDFFKKVTLLIASVPALSVILSACTKNESAGDAPPAGQNTLSETDPVAQALGYKQNGAQVDTVKFPKKAGPDGASQQCQSCAQFTGVNGSWGKCNIFPQGLVNSKGWCNSWSAKAKA